MIPPCNTRLNTSRRWEKGNNINTQNKLKKIVFDLPDKVSKEFSDSITTRLIEYTTDSWMNWYGKLIKFKEVNGHTIVPPSIDLLVTVQQK